MKIEEKYHDPILALIKEKGELGVNAIATGIGMPVTSVQKYLERQTYFKKTLAKKWDLPENVTHTITNTQESNRLALLAQSLNTQSLLVSNGLDMFVSTVTDMLRQVESIAPMLESHKPSVARAPTIDKSVSKMLEDVGLMPKIIKQHTDKIPDMYLDLLNNVNWLELHIDMGRLYFKDVLSDALASLITQEAETLPDDVLNTLEGHIK